MSEDEYQQLVERVRQSVANPMISTDTGVEAVQRVGQLAAQEGIEWAVAGGLAMHLYGSPRLTKDIDIIASNHLSLTPRHRLSLAVAVTLLKSASMQSRLIGSCGTMAIRITTVRL